MHGSHLLLAVGRVPNTDDLGLEHAGIETDQRGYSWSTIRCVPDVRVYGPSATATARAHSPTPATTTIEIVADNLLNDAGRKVTDRIVAYGLFTDPPLGRIGMTEAEVRKLGKALLVGKRPMTRVGRAIEKGETQGFMKIVVDADTQANPGCRDPWHERRRGRANPHRCDLRRAPYSTVQRGVRIHPTVSELIPTVLGDMQPLV